MTCRFIDNFDLTDFNAYRIQSTCKRAFFPNSEEQLVELLRSEKQKIIIGNGNNIILSENHYYNEFIILNGCFESITITDNTIEAQSGATLYDLSQIALKYSLSGFEIFSDIPSSVGGAVVMNAGTKEGEIKDILAKVRYFDLSDLKIKERSCDACNFSYRNSFFQQNKNIIVLKAWFNLKRGDQEDIKKRMEQTKAIRWKKQPRDFPNCGSVFKRPEGRFVGPMLDELGFKGFTIGGAQVSEKHSGFIINKNNASGKDILAIIAEIQTQVKTKFNVQLEVEQRII